MPTYYIGTTYYLNTHTGDPDASSALATLGTLFPNGLRVSDEHLDEDEYALVADTATYQNIREAYHAPTDGEFPDGTYPHHRTAHVTPHIANDGKPFLALHVPVIDRDPEVARDLAMWFDQLVLALFGNTLDRARRKQGVTYHQFSRLDTVTISVDGRRPDAFGDTTDPFGAQIYLDASRRMLLILDAMRLSVPDSVLQNALTYARFARHRVDPVSPRMQDVAHHLDIAIRELAYARACNSADDVLVHYAKNAKRWLDRAASVMREVYP